MSFAFARTEEAEKSQASKPLPTFADVPYGSHERQILDFWQAPSTDKPAPVVFYMHGGAWSNGDKRGAPGVETYLKAGISVVSINYRFVRQARAAKVMPPVEWPMHDAKRALQFVKSKSEEWNIDKQRIAVAGNSAGACTMLWLTLHDDMADPSSNDPVARESTIPFCAAVDAAQTTLDPQQMVEWTPNSIYGYHAFGFHSGSGYELRKATFAKFVEQRDTVLQWIKEYSPYEHASKGDPSVYLYYSNRPNVGQPQKDPTHTANFGVKLKERLDELGVPCELVYLGAKDVKHPTVRDYIIAKLAPADAEASGR
ncbi:MAG: alpha/beta hydrolase [Luteolibacter sp.]